MAVSMSSYKTCFVYYLGTETVNKLKAHHFSKPACQYAGPKMRDLEPNIILHLVCDTKIQIVDQDVATIKCHKCNLITTFVNRLLNSSVTKLVLKDDLSQMLCTNTLF